MGSQTIVHRLQQAREDRHVRAVVLRIDSPGGSTLASDRIWREVERVRREKPVVVSMGNLAASGGYYIAMSADHIVADPLTLTGSIGVFMGKADLAGLYDKLGVRHEVIARGENAQLFSDLRPFSVEQRATIEAQLQRFYERFVERVADGRGMSFAQADSVARGRVWSGEDALALGLVDELGTLPDALRVAKELGGLPPDQRVPVVTYQLERSFYDRLMQNLLLQMGVYTLESPLASMAWVRLLPATLVAFSEALDGTPQFRLPWQLDVE
jgi:protease-4